MNLDEVNPEWPRRTKEGKEKLQVNKSMGNDFPELCSDIEYLIKAELPEEEWYFESESGIIKGKGNVIDIHRDNMGVELRKKQE